MAEPPEFWTFTLANLATFGLGMILTAVSYYAYRANERRRSFRNATIGFGSVTLGMVIEPMYQVWYKGTYDLGGRELLALQTVEGLFLAVGLGLLFYSIYSHDRGTEETDRRVEEYDRTSGNESRW